LQLDGDLDHGSDTAGRDNRQVAEAAVAGDVATNTALRILAKVQAHRIILSCSEYFKAQVSYCQLCYPY
jgi:hypothetical protein